MGLLNKIHGLVQAGRYLFNVICDDKFEQSEAVRRVFRRFNDGVCAYGRHLCSRSNDNGEVRRSAWRKGLK